MVFLPPDLLAARIRTPPSFGVADNGDGQKEPQRGICVILSAAKDLMPVASGDEVLRLRSGRHELLLLLLLLVLAPALLLRLEERGEHLADGALGDVAGDEHHAALAVVALGPGFERRGRMEDVLHAVDHHRLVGVLDVQDRKSTRLNSSHRCIPYAVFCLKKNIADRTARPRPVRRGLFPESERAPGTPHST